MITKEDGLRYAKLIHVSIDNGLTAQSNKVYIMEEQSDGNIKCEYGRVGSDLVTVYKKSSDWNKVFKSKINPRKGYKDVTDLISETVSTTSGTTTSSKTVEIEDTSVRKLFKDLMAFANKSIQKNYKVTQDAVTQAQVDAAQKILDNAFSLVKVGMDVKQLNDLLIDLYTTIPRKMKDVRDYLMDSNDSKNDVQKIKTFLANEQDTLDTMAGQVKLIKQQSDSITENKVDSPTEFNLLQQMGLDVRVETDPKSIELVKKLSGHNSDRIIKIYKVINKSTQKIFDGNLKETKNKKRRLYFHGSRSENWFNIIQTGLMIRPSGAIHTGSMWDDGIYYASDADKSLGYTNGGRWTGGSSRTNSVYLGLFDVHVGKQLVKDRHDSTCYRISKEVKSGGYDSVHAKKGFSLRKDEFIVYNSKQCTIAYLIEFKY